MLQEQAVLVYFSAGSWAARKLDDSVTRKVQAEYSAGRKSGNYTKYLIAKEEIKKYSDIIQDFRNWLIQFTLPWDNCKGRLLSVKKFQEFNDKFAAAKQDFETAVSEFIANYPDLIEIAKRAGELGGMFNQDEYPPVWKIQDKFSFTVQFMPIQDVNDFRLSIQANELEKIKMETAQTYNQQMQKNAIDLWNRTRETVKHLLDKLSEPETRENGRKSSMKYTTLDKVKALSDFIDCYNFSGDKNLDSIGQMLSDLTKFDIDDIRTDKETKTELTNKTAQILSKIDQYI